MICTKSQVIGMVEVSYTKINKNHEVHWLRFSIIHIVFPLALFLLPTILIVKFEPQKKILELLTAGNSALGILANYKWAYPIVIFIVVSIITKKILSNILHRKYLLHTQREYYLGPTWLLGLASRIDSANTLNARSIPVWQFFKLLIQHENIYYNNIEIEIPEVSSETSNSRAIVTYKKGAKPNLERLIIGISDTYKIDYDKLPAKLKRNNYVEIRSVRSDHNNNREYNPDLVKKFIDAVHEAEKNGVREFSILPNTIPKHIEVIVRECFSDAGRNGSISVYVNESPRSNNYNYTTKRHRIL